MKMYNKELETSQNDEYCSEIEAASGCLKTMAQILESPVSTEVRMQL
jgi:hypothetical protein